MTKGVQLTFRGTVSQDITLTLLYINIPNYLGFLQERWRSKSYLKVTSSNSQANLKKTSKSTIKRKKSRKNCKTWFCVHCSVDQASISEEHWHIKLRQRTAGAIKEGTKTLSNSKVKFKKKIKSTIKQIKL